MAEKWMLIAGAFCLIGAVWMVAMRAVPGKGWLGMTEKLCSGIILCFLMSLAAKSMGLEIKNSPLTALAAGWLGLPGAALAAFLAYWP